MKTKEYTREVEIAHISAIMSFNICDYVKENLIKSIGVIDITELIARWSIEFYEKHIDTNWEKTLKNGMKPLSKKFGSEICWWGQAIADFGYFKFEETNRF